MISETWAIKLTSLPKKYLTYSSIFKARFATAKASLVFIKYRCRSSRSQMFPKISFLKNFVIFTGKHLHWNLVLIKLQAFRCFPVNITKLFRAAFSIELLRWLLLQMFCFTLYFQKDAAEIIVVLHCIIVSFWNLKSLSLLLSFVVPLVAIRCITRCHSLSLVFIRCATRCHSLYYHCHSLSFVVTCCTTCCHSLSLVVTRCTNRLSFYKWSKRTEDVFD